MNTQDITLGRCFSEGWEVFKRNAGLAILAYFLYMLLASAAGGTQIGSIVAAFPLAGGFTMLFLGLQKGLNAEIATLFAGFAGVNNWVRWLGVGWLLFLYQMIVFVVCLIIGGIPIAGGAIVLSCAHCIPGGVLLIVVGCLFTIVACAYYCIRWLFVFFAASEGATALDAIAISEHLTDGVRLRLFWIMIVLTLFNLAGMLFCCIGTLFTCPLTQSVLSALYLDVKQAKAQTPVTGLPTT